MRKSGWYQGFWKSAKTENQIHGRAALDGAGDMRRWDFHEDATPLLRHSLRAYDLGTDCPRR